MKLIYNGTPSNGVCNNTGDTTEIGKSAFNTEHNDPKEDTPFYNERDYVEGVNYPMAFAPRQRIWGTRTDNNQEAVPKTTIKLGATNKEDIFSVSSEIGNGALTYPVGLITSDEVVMAGGRGYISSSNLGTNETYYLYTGSWHWTLSPGGFFSNSKALVIFVDNGGRVGDSESTYLAGTRPVIALQHNILYVNGNGSKEQPYQIEY